LKVDARAWLLLSCLFVACAQQKTSERVVGKWLVELDLGAEKLPFNAEIIESDGKLQFFAYNGEERIRADQFELRGDSLFVRLPVFNTALIGKVTEIGIVGSFWDYSRNADYHIPFVAKGDDSSRFHIRETPKVDVSGKWRVEFSPGSDNEYLAIGLFEQQGDKAVGTFLTTTGDYRFLQGNVSGDSLFLSCFDGSHAFLFKARITGDQIEGDFWSGTHWRENWAGKRDEQFELPDPTSLTFLKPGYEKLDFRLDNLEGNPVSLGDDQYAGKVVIIQLMGTWCPNCKDETAYLVSLHNKFHQQGLEVISLAFEKSNNEETNRSSVLRLKEHFGVPYEILIAGMASKKEAAEKLPMLNHVLSFPTTIFIDREGKVRRVHTGFAGPGTGEYYHEFVEETDRFVTQLLIE
jgi:peroxiredoxin